MRFALPSVIGQSFAKVHCDQCDTELHVKVRRKRGSPKQIEYSAKFTKKPVFESLKEVLNPQATAIFGIDPADTALWKKREVAR